MVRRGLIVPAILAMVLGCGGPVVQETSPRMGEVRRLIEEYDEAIGRKDRGTLEALMSREFVYFTSGGAVRSRWEFIDFLTSDAYEPEHRERSELQLLPHDGVVVIASRWRGHGTYAGTRFDDDQRCSLVVGQLRGEWKLLSEHCTPIRP